ncbi:hypothetical protein scyTo_0022041 [Scyliorhinus torazame]|uniref:Uncharacterized protein n=1 Tax=Scyliorhinus torazame TaxID=75743 RepID=A0A401QB70_SCYTO|nr:hypothetical protein [Scyliorhinus torazame]
MRRGSNRGRDHSTQADCVGTSSPVKQPDRSWWEQHRKRSFRPRRTWRQLLPRRAVGQALEFESDKLMKYLGVDNDREILLSPVTSPR